MIAIVSLLFVLTLSLLVTRVASVALTLTGLSKQSARFQARSAFTGVGFTTSESEKVVQHPVRRRVLMLLMLVGNAGVVTAVGSVLLTMLRFGEGAGVGTHLLVLGGGLAVLWFVSASQHVDRWMSSVIQWALTRYTDLDLRDYASLLHLGGAYTVTEIAVGGGEDWLADRDLRSLGLREEGVLVLAVVRPDGTFLGAPTADTVIGADDTLLVYGRTPALRELSERRHGFAGWSEHREAVEEHEAEVAREAANDPGKGEEA